MKRRWMPLVGWSVLFGLAGTALGDGVVLNGLSPRSIGRGGTNIANADNGAILCDNPAGAVNVEGTGLVDIGFDLMLSDFNFANDRNSSASDDNVYPLPQAAVIRKSCDGQWAYGLGLFVPAGFGEAFDLEGPPPLVGQHHYKSFGSLAKILPSAAFRATDRLSLRYPGSCGHSRRIGGTLLFAGSQPAQGNTDHPRPSGDRCGPMLVVGAPVRTQLRHDRRFDVSKREPFSGGRDDTHNGPGLGQSTFDTTLDVTWPASLGLGVKHELCSHRTFSADLIWFNWSKAFDDFGIHLDNSSNPFFPAIYEQFPLGWRDTVSVRLGYEQRLARNRVFRLGYVHHRNPVPDGTLTPFIQATHEHAVSAGYGWMWRCWNIDLGYMFGFGSERAVVASDFVGGDYDRSFHRAQTHAIAFSFLRKF